MHLKRPSGAPIGDLDGYTGSGATRRSTDETQGHPRSVHGLLGSEMSYHALKNGLGDHQRRKHPVIVRAGRGCYWLPWPRSGWRRWLYPESRPIRHAPAKEAARHTQSGPEWRSS